MAWIKKIEYKNVHRCKLPRTGLFGWCSWEEGSLWQCDTCHKTYEWQLVGGYAGDFEWVQYSGRKM